MKTNTLVQKLLMAMSLLAVISLNSCSKDEEQVSGDDVTNVSSESLSDSYFQDSDEMSSNAVNTPNAAGGRVAADDRFTGATVTVAAGSTKQAGSVSVNFGEVGVKDPRGNTRKGIINIAYSGGPAVTVGFKTITTYQNYSVNDIKLEGTRTITKLPSTPGTTSLKYNTNLDGGKATWPDATSITREADFTAEIAKSTTSPTIAATTTLTGTASGTDKKQKAYSMEITKALVFKSECIIADAIYMAAQGTKKFVSNGHELIVDYGDGTCDRSVTLTVGAASRVVNLEKK